MLVLTRFDYWLHRQLLRVRRRFRKQTDAEIRAETLASIRANMAALGHPIWHLTDEQIEEGVAAMTRAIAACGVSTAEFGARLSALGSALRSH